MSAVSSRPRVRRVSSSVIAAAGAGALVLAGRALRELLATMDAEAAQRLLGTATTGIAPIDTLKMDALAAIDDAAFAVPPAVPHAVLRALMLAATPQAVADARAQAWTTLSAAHAQTLTRGVAAACASAARTLGFDEIETRPATIGEGLRVLAVNADGRTLVSEVSPSTNGDLTVQTEIIGVTDGSCHAVLDRFDAEMERLGVNGKPTRRSTGGVCQLAAAREFIKRVPLRRTATAEPSRQRPVSRRRSAAAAAIKGGQR